MYPNKNTNIRVLLPLLHFENIHSVPTAAKNANGNTIKNALVVLGMSSSVIAAATGETANTRNHKGSNLFSLLYIAK